MGNIDVFDGLNLARNMLMAIAKEQCVRLKHIEFVVPFVENDKRICVWIFYEKSSDIDDYESNGITKFLKDKFIECCSNTHLPVQYVDNLFFNIDSEENVIKNYAGSYFYRLRG